MTNHSFYLGYKKSGGRECHWSLKAQGLGKDCSVPSGGHGVQMSEGKFCPGSQRAPPGGCDWEQAGQTCDKNWVKDIHITLQGRMVCTSRYFPAMRCGGSRTYTKRVFFFCKIQELITIILNPLKGKASFFLIMVCIHSINMYYIYIFNQYISTYITYHIYRY